MSTKTKNINYEDFINICRICMFHCDVKFIRDRVITKIFYKLTEIQFEANDELPQQICLKCFEKLNEIHEFAFQCQRSHSILTDCLNKFKTSKLNGQQEVELEKNDVIDEDVFKEWNMIVDTLETTKSQENTIPEILNSPNIIIKKEEVHDYADLNDTNSDLNSTNNFDDSNVDSTEINEQQIADSRAENNTKLCKLLKGPKKHKRRNKDKRPYKCEHCPKLFSTASKWKEHMCTHSDERPFECEQCSKSFAHIRYLKQHMRIHNNERPFVCEQCSKTFYSKSNLKSHMKTHSGDRPFKCKLCSKSYIQASSLNVHMRKHLDERPHKCDQCSKTFVQLYRLKRHMRTHHKQIQ